MNPSPNGSGPRDPAGDAARSWWLTAVFAAVVAMLSASYRSLWSVAATGLLAGIAVLAAARGRRARAVPASAAVTALVAGLVAGAAVLCIAAVLAARG